MMRAHDGINRGAFAHEARLYRSAGELERGVCRLVEDGLRAGGALLVLAPGARLRAHRAVVRAAPDRVTLQDMTGIGLNPARIIPTLLDWIDRAPSPARIVCEPLWEGRSSAEIVEVLRHEALVESALCSAKAEMLCVYQETALPPCARASLERSHHTLRAGGGRARERGTRPHPASDVLGRAPLEPPCEPVEEVPVTRDLRRMRRQVKASAAVSALAPERRSDFVLAVNEAATNALQYGGPPRALRLWCRGRTVVGEVVGRGRIEDPLVGRRRPASSAIRGRGLWMVNQLCDLVELRSSRSRTTLRMHKRCA